MFEGKPVFLEAAVAAWFLALVSPLPADTVFLKDGTHIADCQVVSETAAAVSLRTPAGDMVVPRDRIDRIQKSRTVHDQYAEQMARLKDGDVNGSFQLAQWCRSMTVLRKEADELLLKVIALKPDHAEARRLLGHIKVGDGWVAPRPLSLRLQIAGSAGKHGPDLEKQVSLFIRARQDLRLEAGAEAADSLDVCTLTISLSLSQKAPPTFYGKTLGRPELGASVGLTAQSDWLGKTPLKVTVDGSIPAGGPNAEKTAIQNAVGKGGKGLHKFFDDLQYQRARLLAKGLEKKKETGKKARPAGAKSLP
jgi:hypothetical protein